MAIILSTSEVPAHEGATYWREVVIREMARHEFHSSVGPQFRGSLRIGTVGAITVSDFDCDPCEVGRTARDLASCRSDDFMLMVQLAGRSILSQDGRDAVLEKGSIAFIDTVRPCSAAHQTEIKCLAVTIPRRALESRLANAAGLVARAMPAHMPIAGLVSGFFSLLSQRVDDLASPAGAVIAEQAIDLIALAFSLETKQGAVTLSSPRAITLLRLKSVIEARLSETDLKPAAVAAQAGISVRYANALLAQEGYSLERFILHRRLERCRRALEDRRQTSRTIGEIAFAWGFSDLSHFWRRFRAAYGCAPGDYRRRVSDGLLQDGFPEAGS
jgi:AraC family transcriptional regulator, positive regulator of tynA and feaB